MSGLIIPLRPVINQATGYYYLPNEFCDKLLLYGQPSIAEDAAASRSRRIIYFNSLYSVLFHCLRYSNIALSMIDALGDVASGTGGVEAKELDGVEGLFLSLFAHVIATNGIPSNPIWTLYAAQATIGDLAFVPFFDIIGGGLGLMTRATYLTLVPGAANDVTRLSLVETAENSAATRRAVSGMDAGGGRNASITTFASDGTYEVQATVIDAAGIVNTATIAYLANGTTTPPTAARA